MSFSFDFFNNNDINNDNNNDNNNNNNNNNNINNNDNSSLEIIYNNDININNKHNFIEYTIDNHHYYQSINHYHSGLDEKLDVIPGKYEGGYKLWECSNDLVEYLIKNDLSLIKSNTNVLELGCGHGFPGITTMIIGYKTVLFSDMNKEVIEQTTWPNIIKNSNNNSNYNINNCRCISGDWELLSIGLQNNYYNDIPNVFGLILSAETLYTSIHCKKVYDMLIKHLDINGIALIATKRYYFGVGGGSLELEEIIKSNSNGQLTFNIIEVFEDGQSNIRELIKITKSY